MDKLPIHSEMVDEVQQFPLGTHGMHEMEITGARNMSLQHSKPTMSYEMPHGTNDGPTWLLPISCSSFFRARVLFSLLQIA